MKQIINILLLVIICIATACKENKKKESKTPVLTEDTIVVLKDVKFQSPMAIPLLLAGNFGELRSNHFHTGIDIKTCGDEGLPIYAAAEGYISRVSVSPVGYGNAVYIDHPNGFTTVYAHLWRFKDSLQAFVRRQQYEKENFGLDIHFDPNHFKVEAGELIAFSGNSGGSRAPHLHFEIRETKSEKPVNPLLFGYSVPDSAAPTLKAVKVYPLDSNSYVKFYYTNGRVGVATFGEGLIFSTRSDGNNLYSPLNINKIEGWGVLGFALNGFDTKDSTYNIYGIHRIELSANGKQLYSHSMNKLDFSTWRYINAHIDHAELYKSRRRFERSYILPNNKLEIYTGNGKLFLEPADTFKIAYKAADVHNNESVINFNVVGVALKDEKIKYNAGNNDYLLAENQQSDIKVDGFWAKIPAGALYEPVNVSYKTSTVKTVHNVYSKVHSVGDINIPFQEAYQLAIKAEILPDELQDKACIISTYGTYMGGSFDTGWVKTSVKTFGSFFVTADVVAPVIRPLNIRNNMNMSRKHTIDFIIKDNLSGIKGWRGEIDGKWVLFTYDAKNQFLSYIFDEYCPPGKRNLTLEVWDDKGNKQTVNYNFTR